MGFSIAKRITRPYHKDMQTLDSYQPVTGETSLMDEIPATTPLAQAFAAEIRAELARKKISGLKLAGQVGMSQNYVSKRLRDEYPFTLDDIAAICDALGESFQDLATRAITNTH